MRRGLNCWLTLGVVGLCFSIGAPALAGGAWRFVYRIATGAKLSRSSETLVPVPSGYLLRVDTQGPDISQNQAFELDADLGSRSWRRRNEAEGTDFTAVRLGDVVNVTGTFGGRPVSRRYRLTSLPWKQCFPVDLQPWATSAAPSLTFCAVNPINLGFNTFTAVKRGVETIVVGGKTLQALRVTVTPEGLLGAFWHCDVWFRGVDGRYVRFEAASGLPGAPLTVIELESEEEGPPDVRPLPPPVRLPSGALPV